MIGFFARVLPWLVILLTWFYMNRRLDLIQDKSDYLRCHKVWGKVYFLYGWLINGSKTGTIVRYVITGIIGFYLARWFFLATSTGR